MFVETHEALLVSEQQLALQEDACRATEEDLKKKHGIPLWIRRGYTKGSVTFAVSRSTSAPRGRTFPNSVTQSPWVLHVE